MEASPSQFPSVSVAVLVALVMVALTASLTCLAWQLLPQCLAGATVADLIGYIVQKAVQKLNADGFGERNKL